MKFRDLKAVEEVKRHELTKIIGGELLTEGTPPTVTFAPGMEFSSFAQNGEFPDLIKGYGQVLGPEASATQGQTRAVPGIDLVWTPGTVITNPAFPKSGR